MKLEMDIASLPLRMQLHGQGGVPWAVYCLANKSKRFFQEGNAPAQDIAYVRASPCGSPGLSQTGKKVLGRSTAALHTTIYHISTSTLFGI